METQRSAPTVEQEIIVSVTPQETRVALMENKVLCEIAFEPAREKRIGGSIYKGRVSRVLPGMQAAFVDIGLDKAAFLYVSDVEGQMRHMPEEGETEENFHKRRRPTMSIDKLLHEGQEIIVQVAKEPLGRKGARITQHISLPGRNIVFLPNVDHVGVSRRIEDEEERERLRALVEQLSSDLFAEAGNKGADGEDAGEGKESQGGFIVRTVAVDCGPDELKMEMEFLVRLWEQIAVRAKPASAPNILHADLDLVARSVRDLYNPWVSRIVVDSSDQYRQMVEFVETYVPEAKMAVELYSRPEPIFEFYGIEIEISRALEKRVWLKSGGYIIIEMTEALTAIDVNTGSFVGKRNLEETILKTNLEAAREIAYQLRLRNIGGIIIIDFIDMEEEDNRLRVFETFRTEFEKDRARTNLLEISSLGLVEMTRKRVGENLGRSLSEPCPHCEGTGLVRSKSTVAAEIFREMRRKHLQLAGKEIIVEANKEVVAFICEDERVGLEMLEQNLEKTITFKARSDLHQEEYNVVGGS